MSDLIDVNVMKDKCRSKEPVQFPKFPRSAVQMMILTLLALAASFTSARAKDMAQAASPADMWIEMLIGPPLVPLFNQIARSDDIARVDHHSQVGQLAGINGGRKMVIFKSVSEAEQFLPGLVGQIDIAGYNLEHGPGTPGDEQADPVGSIQRMRALTDEHDLALALGPDHDFALSHGVQMAPYVDFFVLQIQRQQTNPPVVKEFIIPLVPQLRAANPDLQISAQVRTEGDVGDLIELLDSLKEYLDGVSILTSPETVETAEALISRLRPAHRLYLPQVTADR